MDEKISGNRYKRKRIKWYQLSKDFTIIKRFTNEIKEINEP